MTDPTDGPVASAELEVCPGCGQRLNPCENRKIRLEPHRYGWRDDRLARRARDHFTVRCPRCGHEYASDAFKLLGLFSFTTIWMLIALVAMAAILGVPLLFAFGVIF